MKYPGSLANSKQILQLSSKYKTAAELLHITEHKGNPPWRFLAIHSIELYLNALLLHSGYDSTRIRQLNHNLAGHSELAIGQGLKLKKRTAEHLIAISENREYLISRYEPDAPDDISQINRLTATLNEVAEKVTKMLEMSIMKGAIRRAPNALSVSRRVDLQ